MNNKIINLNKLIIYLLIFIFPSSLLLYEVKASLPFLPKDQKLYWDKPPKEKGDYYVCELGRARKKLFWRDSLYLEKPFPTETYIFDAQFFVGKKFLSDSDLEILVNEIFMSRNINTPNQYNLVAIDFAENTKKAYRWMWEDSMFVLQMKNKNDFIKMMMKEEKLALIDKNNFVRTNFIQFYKHWNDNNVYGINELEIPLVKRKFNCGGRRIDKANNSFIDFIHEREINVITFPIENSYGEWNLVPQSILVLDAFVPLSPLPKDREDNPSF